MKNFLFAHCCALLLAVSCSDELYFKAPEPASEPITSLKDVARILSEVPLSQGHLQEVFDAVNSSSSNGFDEEYLMADLFLSPGKGVGQSATKAPAKEYESPLRDAILNYLSSTSSSTRASGFDAQEFINAVTDAGMQIYWPYSEDWDGETFPIITFDPGFGMSSNYGYRIRRDPEGIKIVDSVYVDENLAQRVPVWVINTNDDSALTPLGPLAVKAEGDGVLSAPSLSKETGAVMRKLYLRTFEAKRNYDTWFGGASEFFVKCGSVDGFSASTEAELGLYFPSVTDFMIVVKRKDINKPLQYDALLMTDFTNQIEKIAFLLNEDDGGTQTSWKCSATVKIKSKSYGFDMEIPYRDKDDIVWRGQLSAAFLQSEDEVKGRFGDVEITFALE